MSVEVKCPSCNKMTPVGRLVCQECGSKLHGIQPGDLKRSKKPKAQQYGAPKSGGAVSNIISSVLVLLLLGGLGLFFWPVDSSGDEGDESAAKQADVKLQALYEGIEGAVPRKVTITEEETNAYLQKLMDEAVSGDETAKLKQLAVNLRDNEVEVVVQIGVGPLTISRELVFEPEVSNDMIKVKPKSARFGHLPMPGPLMDVVKNNISNIFYDVEREEKIWKNTSSIAVESGQMTIENFVNR